jgi:hypothetical protein
LLLGATVVPLRGVELLVRHLFAVLAERLESGESRAHLLFGDRFRPELLIDVLLETHSSYALHVAGHCAESKTVQHVDDCFVVRIRGNRRRCTRSCRDPRAVPRRCENHGKGAGSYQKCCARSVPGV